MASLDEMFAEIKKAGWCVNNVFEMADGMWRCNLRRKTQPRIPGDPSGWAHEFSDGATVQEAVAGAIVDMRQPRNNEVDRAVKAKKAPLKAVKNDDDDFWAGAGRKTTKQQIEESGL